MRIFLIIAAVVVYLLVGFALAYFLWRAGAMDDGPILLFVAFWPAATVFTMLFWLFYNADSLVLDLFREISRGRRNRK